MNEPNDWQRELSECLEPGFDAKRFERLQNELLVNPELRNQFVRMRMLHSNLTEIYSIDAVGGMLDAEPFSYDDAIEEAADPAFIANRSAALPFNINLATLGSLVLALSVVVFLCWPTREDATSPSIPGLDFAKVTGAWNAIASDGQAEADTLNQSLFRERSIALAAGSVEVSLTSGVGILFEGPGQLEFLSDRKAHLHSGQAVVHVPKGSGIFELETSATLLGDQGTEFGAKITHGMGTEIQVFDGHVIASSHDEKNSQFLPQRIDAGDAVRIAINGHADFERITYSPNRFLRHKDIPPGIEWPHETRRNGTNVFKKYRHASIEVPFATHNIVIDGQLEEWSPEFMIRSELTDSRSQEPEQFAFGLRYDENSLYMAAIVEDAFPLRSQVDPELDPEFGWRGGGLQVRLSTDRALGWPIESNSPEYFRNRTSIQASHADVERAANRKISHLTMWYHAASKQACLYVVHGMDLDSPMNKNMTQVEPSNFGGSWRRITSDNGYTVEYRIPWSLLNAADDPPQEGDVLPFNLTVHWSCQAGRIWQNKAVEIRNPAEPIKIFTFERASTWGAAKFLPTTTPRQ